MCRFDNVCRLVPGAGMCGNCALQSESSGGAELMTIAIGLMCNEGIVVAADTHQSTGYAGDLKTTARKISNISGGAAGALVISGAGPSRYLESIKEQLEAAFGDEPGFGTAHEAPEDIGNTSAIEEKFSSILEEFYTSTCSNHLNASCSILTSLLHS
jgi:hypothetical protein